MEEALKRMLTTGSGDSQVVTVSKGGKGKGKGRKGKSRNYDINASGTAHEIDVEKRATTERIPNVGLHTIEIYYPQFYITQLDMEEVDARPERYGPSVIGKYTKGVGQVEARFPSDDEDIISYAMTVVHRLLERMEAKGINETGRYQNDGKTIPNLWNAVGRLDVGTESITDRSKSVKSYIMDMFERYGGESNVEGIDQYNACYGGQGATLSVVNWVECDRWDGRYGIGVAVDISEAPGFFFFTIGAACSAALVFPDAPMAHHSVRASCILHRFDFCKPTGWHHMGPVTDGKYSIECYMEAVDITYRSIRKKLNGRELFPLTDYNVFHTGGGFHVVKKAFARLIRADCPHVKGEAADALTKKRLIPSTHILKIIGPCHTVSSFLNISSVAMNEWDQALGKVLVVFTYGSGCAATMYQLRFDDVPFYDPFPIWKVKFYEKARYCYPDFAFQVHEPYLGSWMNFPFVPKARAELGMDLRCLEDDVYYLLEIDNFGRRFYHRGGMKTPPIPKNERTEADVAESRKMREHYPALPPPKKEEDKPAGKSMVDMWKEIEYSLTCDDEDDTEDIAVGIYRDRYDPGYLTQIVKEKKKEPKTFAPDGLEHSYQIVGTWNQWMPQDMLNRSKGTFVFEVTLGENRWEEFHIIQDHNPEKRIYPYADKASGGVPCIGPHAGEAGQEKNWLLDCRDRVTVDPVEQGMPGDKYMVTFSWQEMKDVRWEKMSGAKGSWQKGKYYIIGSWTSFEPVELEEDEELGDGWYVLPEVQMTSLGIEFLFVRNKDMSQKFYPQPEDNGDLSYPNNYYAPICGPNNAVGGNWVVEDSSMRSVYKISFYRDPDDVEESGLRLEWEHVADREPKEYPAEYFIIGDFNAWGAEGYTKMEQKSNQTGAFIGKIKIRSDEGEDEKTNVESFQILMHKRRDRCIHPSRDECTQVMPHEVVMDNAKVGSKCWHIGKNPQDQAKKDDTFNVQLLATGDGKLDVSWFKA